ncbi:peptide/nickel transport system substrate-binding protein [Paracoccus isoporae]|uniref:Peptide/nickel transport system substrate-binding protein n=1 Tax=Paracoccus isoporae TaxID=591205 RepID=A0A1G7AH64_9RHOB|nr:extracellular solute-binding protein [Paracoccus isoporae]SDE13395.1 peptide/nickel transport system substrate-binding protein [Paracoccus isoporae]
MQIIKNPNESAISAAFLAGFAMFTTVAAMPLASVAEPSHGIAMYGEPALPEGFAHLPYANPEAPEGGTIRLAESGSFDSLKPWVLKGSPAWPVYTMPGVLAETLMLRSMDEPFTLYGLLAESVETDEARSWVEFTLRPEARFSDGSPVTVGDVMWSYETLGTQGHPRYRGAWSKVESMEQTGPNKVRFTFNTQDRELALLMGMRPILKKAQWEGTDFSQSGLEVPIGSGPYVIENVDPGRAFTFRKNPDWWGKDLPINQGLHNFDRVIYDYFGDNNAMFEAFKAGDIDVWRELSPTKWDTEYDFPRAVAGEITKSEIPNERPSGIMGLVMNTRNPVFADWRVRQAMIEAFNWKFINATLSGGQERRITSYFANSELAMTPDAPAEGRVLELLQPFAEELPPGAIDGYALPEGADRPLDRGAMRRALSLLEEAGWTVRDGALVNGDGEPMAFEILLNQSGAAMTTASEMKQLVDIFVESLRSLGINARITMLDSAQYIERTNNYAFDMTWYDRALSLSPGNEQLLYWGSAGVSDPGTRNFMGMASPAAEAMIDEMLNAASREDFVSAVRALDRILTAGRYVIPAGYSPVSRLAHDTTLKFPDEIPTYGDYPGFLPETWWRETAAP